VGQDEIYAYHRLILNNLRYLSDSNLLPSFQYSIEAHRYDYCGDVCYYCGGV
jgi:hypothetical protein